MNFIALFDVFRKGESVVEQAAAKNRAGLVVALSGLLVAVNHAYPIGVDQPTADAIATVVGFVASLFGIFATSDKVGLLPAKPVSVDDGQDNLRGGA
jgi:hypothetical protein